MTLAPIQVDVFSDLVCPWCFIGKRRLAKAIDLFGGPVEVRWRAFQLQPGLPPEGVPSREYFAARFGDAATIDAMRARVAAEGEKDGIAFAFERIERFPNTLLAHRAVALAAEQGAGGAAEEALFAGHFERGLDLGDQAAVLATLEEAGVRVDAGALAAGGGAESVAADLATARELGITGVPFFIADGRFAISGALPPEHLVKLLQHARAQRGAAAA
jgi:predicted DsbA family dithiol-disulfide isomerase